MSRFSPTHPEAPTSPVAASHRTVDRPTWTAAQGVTNRYSPPEGSLSAMVPSFFLPCATPPPPVVPPLLDLVALTLQQLPTSSRLVVVSSPVTLSFIETLTRVVLSLPQCANQNRKLAIAIASFSSKVHASQTLVGDVLYNGVSKNNKFCLILYFLLLPWTMYIFWKQWGWWVKPIQRSLNSILFSVFKNFVLPLLWWHQFLMAFLDFWQLLRCISQLIKWLMEKLTGTGSLVCNPWLMKKQFEDDIGNCLLLCTLIKINL